MPRILCTRSSRLGRGAGLEADRSLAAAGRQTDGGQFRLVAVHDGPEGVADALRLCAVARLEAVPGRPAGEPVGVGELIRAVLDVERVQEGDQELGPDRIVMRSHITIVTH